MVTTFIGSGAGGPVTSTRTGLRRSEPLGTGADGQAPGRPRGERPVAPRVQALQEPLPGSTVTAAAEVIAFRINQTRRKEPP